MNSITLGNSTCRWIESRLRKLVELLEGSANGVLINITPYHKSFTREPSELHHLKEHHTLHFIGFGVDKAKQKGTLNLYLDHFTDKEVNSP